MSLSFRNVLAATDFSADAWNAARRAAQVAVEHGAALRLLHVVEQDLLVQLRNWVQTDRDLPRLVAEQAEIELAAAARELGRQQPLRVGHALRQGDALSELAGAQQQADLVVLGARGSHAVRELALGTTADRLLRTATRPLLVVKRPPGGPYRRVLLLAGLGPSTGTATALATGLAPEADITLLHAFEVPFEGKLRLAGVEETEILRYRTEAKERALAEIEKLLAAHGDRGRTSVVVRGGDIRQELRTALDDLKPDLVVVAKTGRSHMADLFLGSVTRVVLAEAPCDVLVVPPPAPAA